MGEIVCVKLLSNNGGEIHCILESVFIYDILLNLEIQKKEPEYDASLEAQKEAGHVEEAASASDPGAVLESIAAGTPEAAASGPASRKRMRYKITVHAIGQSSPAISRDGLCSGATEDTSAFYSVRCMQRGESPDPRSTL